MDAFEPAPERFLKQLPPVRRLGRGALSQEIDLDNVPGIATVAPTLRLRARADGFRPGQSRFPGQFAGQAQCQSQDAQPPNRLGFVEGMRK